MLENDQSTRVVVSKQTNKHVNKLVKSRTQSPSHELLPLAELPRTQKDFEESYTFKIFCFEFVNSYSYLFYLAFFKQALTWLPPEYNYLEIAGVNARWEEVLKF